jgi:hypothetical protein
MKMLTIHHYPAVAAAVLAVVMAASANVGNCAHLMPVDDPTPPSVPYLAPSQDGPVLPGNQVLPAICAHAMRACGYTLDPGTMTWQPSG